MSIEVPLAQRMTNDVRSKRKMWKENYRILNMIQQAMVQGQVVVAGEFAILGPQEEEITEAEKIATSSMGGRKGKGENRKSKAHTRCRNDYNGDGNRIGANQIG